MRRQASIPWTRLRRPLIAIEPGEGHTGQLNEDNIAYLPSLQQRGYSPGTADRGLAALGGFLRLEWTVIGLPVISRSSALAFS